MYVPSLAEGGLVAGGILKLNTGIVRSTRIGQKIPLQRICIPRF